MLFFDDRQIGDVDRVDEGEAQVTHEQPADDALVGAPGREVAGKVEAESLGDERPAVDELDAGVTVGAVLGHSFSSGSR